jgi:hypothetical protein
VPFSGPAKLQAIHLPDDGVIVYQFHRRFRCDACYKLEEAMNETFQTYFQEELRTGRLIFRVMDLDEIYTRRNTISSTTPSSWWISKTAKRPDSRTLKKYGVW